MIIFVTKISRIMAKNIDCTPRVKKVTLEAALNQFLEDESVYYAAKKFLEDGLGIYTEAQNPDFSMKDTDFFTFNRGVNFSYIRNAFKKIKHIKPLGIIKGRTLLSTGSESRYKTIGVFACDAETRLTRDDITALSRGFNRAYSEQKENKKNRPVLVVIRDGKKMSISTCERFPRTDTDKQDTIGKSVVLYNLNCEKPLQGHLQILKGLAKDVKKSTSFDDLYTKIVKSLSVDIVSDKFFSGYKSLFQKIVKYASEETKIKKEFDQFSNPNKAIRDYVKKLMGRIVFIQFLQRKGWMGVPISDASWKTGDPEFLQNLFKRSNHKKSFIKDVLTPLFEDLNSPRNEDRTNPKLGIDIKVPYLNGGLFEKDEYADVKFSIPEEMMEEMLEFFRSYNFTIDENAKDSVEFGVDPEMLSRIFENLLEDNKEKGAFYTPKEIVNYMCREALLAYLQKNINEESKKNAIQDFVDNQSFAQLESDDIKAIDQKLKEVKICDPAIGSGAFPMGMLKLLLDCRKAIFLHLNNGECSPSEIQNIKKDIVQNSIYGVDIEKGAVDIARLRFWLALIIEEETPHALPNMDFKIMQGNSLLERYEGVDLSKIEVEEKKKRKGKKKQNAKNSLELDLDETSAIANIQTYIRAYYQTDSFKAKIDLRHQINNYVRSFIGHKEGWTPSIQRKLETLPIPNDQFFLWHIYFKEVFDKGGFDIVIGNPPYIALQKMKKMSKVYSKCDYDTYDSTGDIYCLFTEQGFNLLKEGGTLCYIMPNKWMKADYGKKLRTYLLQKRINNIVDFGDIQLFKDATTYPCILLLENDKPNSTFKASRLRSSDMNSVSELSSVFNTQDFNEDTWVVTSSQDKMLYDKLKLAFPILKEYLGNPVDIPVDIIEDEEDNSEDNSVKYGIKTGLSKAYLISKEIKESIITKDKKSEEIIVPFLSGKDIKPYEQPCPKKYLILLKKGDTLKMMGKSEATEEEAWNYIISRYPGVCNWLKQFEVKARARSDQGDYWWELRACDYYDQFTKPKIMYQTFQVKPNFIYDTHGSFCNNSMWILPTRNKALLGLFNSKIGWWLISNYCSQIQSGYQLIWEYFNRIPVALTGDLSEIEKNVDDILREREDNNNADITEYKNNIDKYLYELYGLTNGEVKVIDPDMPTFGADFELYKRKNDFKIMPDEELDKIYNELRERFNKLSMALGDDETKISGHYNLKDDKKPSKEELEDAFYNWNCAIMTAFRGSETLSKDENLERNEQRNEELKAEMHKQGKLFRPVDGYYMEVEERTGVRVKVPVNEFSFFVTNTDYNGSKRNDPDKEKEFFKEIYRLAEHYEQDSFLFTFPGANRVAFLVATNKGGRDCFRNNVRFAGPLYTDVKDLDAWTGCSNDDKIAFILKGIAQKPVPEHNAVWIGEGDIFDIEHYYLKAKPLPSSLLIIHDQNEDLTKECEKYRKIHDNMFEYTFDKFDSNEALTDEVTRLLNNLPQKKDMVIGFHCSVSINESSEAGARAAYKAVIQWAHSQKKLKKIIIFDMYGDYWKINE